MAEAAMSAAMAARMDTAMAAAMSAARAAAMSANHNVSQREQEAANQAHGIPPFRHEPKVRHDNEHRIVSHGDNGDVERAAQCNRQETTAHCDRSIDAEANKMAGEKMAAC